MIKKKWFFYDRKIRSIFICSKIWKRFFYEENFIHKINLCYMGQTKHTTINTIMHDLFSLFQNPHILKKSDMYLRKIQIRFCFMKNSDLHLRKMQINVLMKKKIKFASNEDANQFLIWEKFKSANDDDAYPFFV